MNEKISIIVPTYNNASYIQRCVDSLTNQTYSNIEIIIIDDGSTDNTEEIILTNYSQNKKVFYYKQENHGVSYARNFGLTKASGDYITFVDGDDWLDLDYLASCYQYLKNNQLDIVRTSYKKDYTDGKQEEKEFAPNSVNLLSQEDIRYRLLYTTDLNPCWGQLIKREIIQKNDRFPEKIICGEDLYFNILLLHHPVKMGYCSQSFYHYYCNDTSVTRRKNPMLSYQKCQNIIVVLNKLYELDLDEKVIAQKMYFEIEHYLRRYVIESNFSTKEYVQTIHNLLEDKTLEKTNANFSTKRDKKLFSSKRWILTLLIYKRHIRTYIYINKAIQPLKRR